MAAPLVYPESLPCPQRASFQRSERRALSSIPGQRRSRVLWRDRHGVEPVQFLLTFEQTLIWRNWFEIDQVQGGAWFSATWRLPSGRNGVYRFMDSPGFPEFVPKIGWRVSALVEVRGRGMAPQSGHAAHVCAEGPAWSASVVPNREWAPAIVFGTRFVAPAIAVNGSTPGDAAWSDDGVTWHLASPGPALSNGFSCTSVAYNPANGLYFMVGNQANKRFVSTDGKIWSDATGQPNVSNGIRFATWAANGEFLFVTSSSRVYSTVDGNSPIMHSTPEQFTTGCYANGKHYAVCLNTRNIYTSLDKTTWTLLATTSNASGFGTIKIVSGAANQLIAISANQQNKISYSSDGGATWHDSVGLPVPASFYQDAIYAQGVFMVVDFDGNCFTSADGGATFTLNASSLFPIGAGTNVTWTVAYDGNGLYAAVQAVVTTTAAVGHC